MAFHGRSWWIIWRDADGKTHFDNANTASAIEAQRILAGRVLPRAKAMVALLEQIIDGTPWNAAPEAAASRRNRPATGEARPRANRKVAAPAARTGGTNPRQGSPRKGGQAA